VCSVKSDKCFKRHLFTLDTGPQSFCYSFIALSIIRCSKSFHKFALRMCRVVTVVMATTQLVLRQFKKFLSYHLRTERGLSLPKRISKCCELVKLCHIYCSGPVFETHCILCLLLDLRENLLRLFNVCTPNLSIYDF